MIESLDKKSINQEALIIHWRQNPVQAAKDIFDVDLDRHQRLTLPQMWFNTTQTNILSRGTGKCVSPDTLVFTDRGLTRIGDIAECQPGEAASIDVTVYGLRGPVAAKQWYNDGEQEGFHVVTDYGFEVRGTSAHRIICWSANGYQEKRLDEICEGDVVAVPRGMGLFGNKVRLEWSVPDRSIGGPWGEYECPTELDDRLAYLLGLLVGDGTCGYREWVALTTADEELWNVFGNLCSELFGRQITNATCGEKCPTWKLCSVPVREFLRQIGLGLCSARQKSVPRCILSAPRNLVAAFLSGLFDTDGGVDRRDLISLGTSSERLAIEVQLLLTNFGIISDRRYKPSVEAWELEISSDAVDLFEKEIGFRLSRKQEDLEREVRTRNPNRDLVPMLAGLLSQIKREAMQRGIVISKRVPAYQKLYAYIAGIYNPSYASLERILLSLPDLAGFAPYDLLCDLCDNKPFFDLVKTKTPFRGPVCDLVVPEGHLFCANGFVQHNTFLDSLCASLEGILKPSYRIGLLAPSYRQCLFVDGGCTPLFTNTGMVNEPLDLLKMKNEMGIQAIDSVCKVKNKWINEEQDGFRITTSGGFEFGGPNGHRVLALGENLTLIYRTVKDLQPGDLLVIRKGFNLFGDNDKSPEFHFETNGRHSECAIPEFISPDVAYLIGLIAGDGCISRRKGQAADRVIFTNNDDDLRSCFESIILDCFGVEVKEHNQEDRIPQLVAQCEQLAAFLLTCGMTCTTALDKSVPEVIRRGSRTNVCNFLGGLFDTDGCVYSQESKGTSIHLATSSHVMAKQVQCLLLNLGILSTLAKEEARETQFPTRDVPSQCSASFKVRICGLDNLRRFHATIGFRCERKMNVLGQSIENAKRMGNSDTIPLCGSVVRRIRERCRGKLPFHSPKENKVLSQIGNRLKSSNADCFTHLRLRQLLDVADSLDVRDSDTENLRRVLDLNLSFLEVRTKTPHRARSIDIEVDREDCYFAGGFMHHNSKLMWTELENLYQRSPIFQESVVKPPVITPEKCHVRFKAAPGKIGTVIEALPMGSDGAKIRGARYFSRYIDEGAQVPKDILNIVVKGFGVTRPNPMEMVRMVEEQKRLLALGQITQDQIIKPPPNREVFSTTAFYQWNHAWERVNRLIEFLQMQKRRHERGEPVDASDFIFKGEGLNNGQIPYRIMTDGKRGLAAFTCMDPSEGFIDYDTIIEAKREMSDYQFRMEYMGFFPPDSEGFFRRSLLDKARGHFEFGVQLKPREGCEYVLGVDPARIHDNFSIAVFEVDKDAEEIRLVRVKAWNKKSFPLCHQWLRETIREYNVEYFEMDAQGGGATIRDLLALEEVCPIGEELILEQEFEEHRFLTGRRILGKLFEFGNYQLLHDANQNLLSGLQHGRLKIAALSPLPGQIGIVSAEFDDAEEELEKALTEWASIVATATSTGRLHFDTPTKSMRKDRYSSILIGYNAALKVLGLGNKPKRLCSGFWLNGGNHYVRRV